MLALKSFSSETVHAANGPIQFGIAQISCCGKMKWNSVEADQLFISENLADVTCVNCRQTRFFERKKAALTCKKQRKEVNSTLISLITEKGLEHMIFTIMDSMFTSVVRQFVESPEYCLKGNYIGTIMNNKTPEEKAKILAHEIAGDLWLKNGELIIKDSEHAVNIMVSMAKELSVDKLLMHAIDLRRKTSVNKESELGDEVEELRKDLAEAEEYNEKLIGENDDYKRQLNKIDDVLNHNK